MAEAIVNVVVDQLISAPSEWLKKEISLIKGVKEALANMSIKMIIIQKVLDDAENKSMTESFIKTWLENLQDICYDMEDVFDEWNTRVLMQKDQESERNPLNEASSSCCFSLKQFIRSTYIKQLGLHRKVALRIKEINEKLDTVISEMDQFSLISKMVVHDDQTKSIYKVNSDRITTSDVVMSEIHGRDDVINVLLLKILTEDSEELENNLKVISIVGAGGLGKTTLAQVVYNDETVTTQSKKMKIWVCVSDPFDEEKVVRGILEGMGIDHNKMGQLENLYNSIRSSEPEQRLLIVLDDVWEGKWTTWRKLRICLQNRRSRSTILVTTRSEQVAKVMGTTGTNMIKPRLISDLDCWSIISQIALGETKDNYLEAIGKKIAEKCKGLPLAARTLGGLLLLKSTQEQWEEVLKSEIWELENKGLDLFPHLFLSYRELPATLKRCFSYFSLFPKDSFIPHDQLVSLWMAQGYLKPKGSDDDMMQIGKDYFKFLVSRALLEQKMTVECMASMHDIIHDFAMHLVGHEFLSVVQGNDNSKKLPNKESEKVRHLYIRGNINPMEICNRGKLRSCIVTGLPQVVIEDLVQHLKVVRALYLTSCNMEQVPQEIGNLIHLRTLDLSNNPFSELPTTIGELYNLQFLWLEKLSKLSSIPQPIGKLINLQQLRGLHFGTGSHNLALLKNLNQLRGVLEIHFTDEDDLREAKLEQKLFIKELAFHFNGPEISDRVFESVQGPPNLQCLQISDLCCETLPKWITGLKHLSKLVVSNAPLVSSLPALGKLLCLKELELNGLLGLECLSRLFLGIEDNNSNEEEFCSFGELVELKVSYCPNLAVWDDIETEDTVPVMRKLEILEIVACSRLKKFPCLLLSRVRSLKRLVVSEGSLLESSTFMKSFQYITSLHLESINNAESLPPLGDLIFLEKLLIKNLPSLECISREFLGIDHGGKTEITIFPKLTELLINGCDKLEKWEDLEPAEELLINGCDKLEKWEDLEPAEELLINGCDKLEKWEDLEPAEEENYVNVTVMPNLQNLLITRCPKFTQLPCMLLRKLSSLKRLVIPICEPTFTLGGMNGSEQNHRSLECFRISKCQGSILPESILHLTNLIRLTVYNAEDVTSLPALGKLPFLQELYIEEFAAVTSIGKEFLGIDITNNDSFVGFPKLVKLDLKCLNNLKEWNDIEEEDENTFVIMPELQVLEIRYCPQLQKLPEHLLCGAPRLRRLNFHDNNNSLAESLKTINEAIVARKGKGKEHLSLS